MSNEALILSYGLILLAMAKPSAAEIEVELWAVPNGSYSLSDRLVKPESPPP